MTVCFILFLLIIINEIFEKCKKIKIKAHYITSAMVFVFLKFGNLFVGDLIKFINIFLKFKSILPNYIRDIDFNKIGNIIGNFGKLDNVYLLF